VWSGVLAVLGFVSLISALIGVIAWAFEVDGVGRVLGVVLIGGPIALLLATWPIALAQMMRAIADVGDAVAGVEVTQDL
jgi:hypothetical protein